MSNTLVRLTTQDPDAVFDGDLYQDLVIPAKSSIALQNLTISQAEGSIIVDNQNDEIEFSLYTNKTFTVPLKNKTYNRLNLPELFDDINQKMNSALVSDEVNLPIKQKYNGSEYFTSINSQGYSQIRYRKSNYYEPRDNVSSCETLNVNRDGAINAGKYTRNGGVQDDNLSWMFSSTPFVMGAGSLKLKITNLAAAKQTSGVEIIFGLSETNPDTIKSTIDITMIKYGVVITGVGAKIKSVFNGVATDSPKNNANNYSYTMELFEGEMRVGVYDAAEFWDSWILQQPYIYGKKLYPIIIFKKTGPNLTKANQAVVSKVNWMANSFYSSSISQQNIIDNEELGGDIPNMSGGNSTMTFKFSGDSLAEFLGFLQSDYTLPKTGNSFDIIAPETNSSTFQPQSVIVELLSLPLKSYDTTSHSRKSILAVIPNLPYIANRLVYEATNPLYIALDNDKEILIRNVKARILNSDLSQLSLEGYATMTLLFK